MKCGVGNEAKPEPIRWVQWFKMCRLKKTIIEMFPADFADKRRFYYFCENQREVEIE